MTFDPSVTGPKVNTSWAEIGEETDFMLGRSEQWRWRRLAVERDASLTRQWSSSLVSTAYRSVNPLGSRQLLIDVKMRSYQNPVQ